MSKIILVYIAFLTVMSITAFVMYGSDKAKAEKNKWRIKESTLLSIGFFGGAFGAIAGMKHFRHKTKHNYFWIVNYIGIAWQIGLLVLLLFKT